MIERVLDRIEAKIDAQDERLMEVLSRLAVLESKNEGTTTNTKAIGWVLSFIVSVVALAISLKH